MPSAVLIAVDVCQGRTAPFDFKRLIRRRMVHRDAPRDKIIYPTMVSSTEEKIKPSRGGRILGEDLSRIAVHEGDEFSSFSLLHGLFLPGVDNKVKTDVTV